MAPFKIGDEVLLVGHRKPRYWVTGWHEAANGTRCYSIQQTSFHKAKYVIESQLELIQK